jgi:tetratricopeptide (TPR) repeat protein
VAGRIARWIKGHAISLVWATATAVATFAATAAGWASIMSVGWFQLLSAAVAALVGGAFAYREHQAQISKRHRRDVPSRLVRETVSEPHPSDLPTDIVDFTGREREVAQLRKLLEHKSIADGPPAVVVSALHGKGGVGKTRLAVHVAHLIKNNYSDGQLYVNLRGAEASSLDVNAVLSGFLSELGVPGAAIPEGTEERSRLYRAKLAGRKVLVVLDNARDEAQVRPLLPGSSTCAVIITSRSRLAGLEGISLLALDVLSEDEAVDLLSRLAGSHRVSAQLDEACRIVRLCGYLPLAVRVAGAQLALRPNQSLRSLANRLADEKSRLEHLRVGDVEVRSSLIIGYSRSSTEIKRLFRLMATLRFADMPAWAIAALINTDLLTAERMADYLVDVGLLDSAGEDQANQFRYRLHDLLRLIGREIAEREDPPALQHAASTSVLNAYLTAAQLAVALLDKKKHERDPPTVGPISLLEPLGVVTSITTDATVWLRVELDNLALAVEQANDAQQWEIACRLATTLTDYYDTHSLWEHWQHSHVQALAAARQMDDGAIEADILWRLGRRFRHGHPDEALEAYNESIRLYEKLGDRKGEATVLLEVGVVHREQGRLTEARNAYITCLQIFTALGDRRRQAYTLRRLAFVETDQASIVDAVTHFQQSLTILEELEDTRWTARTLRGLSIAYRLLGRYSEAETTAQRALTAFRAASDERGAGYALLDLGDVRAEQGRFEEAKKLLMDCVTRFQAANDERGEAYAVLDLSSIYGWQRQYTKAVSNAARARSLCTAVHDVRGVAWAELSMADLSREQGDFAAALEIYSDCLLAFRNLGDHLGVAHLLLRRGIVEVRRGAREAGRSSWRTAATLFAQASMPEATQIEDWLMRLPDKKRCEAGSAVFVIRPGYCHRVEALMGIQRSAYSWKG